MFAELDGVKLYYEDEGEGEPVILIAGINSNHRFWKTMVPMLEGYRVITLDNPGIGQSEYDGEMTIDWVADIVVKLMDFLEISKAHIVGWSWGSQISQSLAIRYGERLQTLTLVSSYQFRPARSAYFMQALVEAVIKGESTMDSVNVCFNSFCLPETKFTEVENASMRMPIPKHPENPVMVLKQMKSMDTFDTTEKTKDIKVPTLVVHGSVDIMVEPIKGRAMGSSIPGCKYVEIPGQGHTIPPELYIEDLKKLLSENKF